MLLFGGSRSSKKKNINQIKILVCIFKFFILFCFFVTHSPTKIKRNFPNMAHIKRVDYKKAKILEHIYIHLNR